MSEENADSRALPDMPPNIDAGALPECDVSVGGGKAMTVCGALFGAAAAVPT